MGNLIQSFLLFHHVYCNNDLKYIMNVVDVFFENYLIAPHNCSFFEKSDNNYFYRSGIFSSN